MLQVIWMPGLDKEPDQSDRRPDEDAERGQCGEDPRTTAAKLKSHFIALLSQPTLHLASRVLSGRA
jgi:hypothetical protein